MKRGEIWWASLREPEGSEPGGRRPVVIVQSDDANASRLRTTLAVALTGNLAWAAARANVSLPAEVTGLPKDSVAHVYNLVTVDRSRLTEKVGRVPRSLMTAIDAGLRAALDL